MRILVVCSGNAPNFDFQKHQAFIYDQIKAVEKAEATIQFDIFFINKKGIKGYLSCWKALTKKIEQGQYDWVHAHFSFSSLLANLQRKVPVIATFHGSDINLPVQRWVSLVVALMSRKTIYVSQQLRRKSIWTSTKKSFVLPCGVDFQTFKPLKKSEARQRMGLLPEKKYILFSSSFDTYVKNYPLAQKAVELLKEEVTLIELKGYTRQQVATLLSAVDAALMTSFSEGSPQFVKEALACNCPVVSTDVGDVKELLAGLKGCYITTYQPEDVAEKLAIVLTRSVDFQSRNSVQNFDNQLIAQRLIEIYKHKV